MIPIWKILYHSSIWLYLALQAWGTNYFLLSVSWAWWDYWDRWNTLFPTASVTNPYLALKSTFTQSGRKKEEIMKRYSSSTFKESQLMIVTRRTQEFRKSSRKENNTRKKKWIKSESLSEYSTSTMRIRERKYQECISKTIEWLFS